MPAGLPHLGFEEKGTVWLHSPGAALGQPRSAPPVLRTLLADKPGAALLSKAAPDKGYIRAAFTACRPPQLLQGGTEALRFLLVQTQRIVLAVNGCFGRGAQQLVSSAVRQVLGGVAGRTRN